MTHEEDSPSSIPPFLRCHLCSNLLHRAVKPECCIRRNRRACRVCAVKFVTKSRKCWSCGAGNFKTSNFQNDLEMREAIKKFQATGEVPLDIQEDADMDEDDNRPRDIDMVDIEKESSNNIVNSVKRDAEGVG